MTRFYFHVCSGKDGLTRNIDVAGVDMPSLENARAEAVRFAGEVLAFNYKEVLAAGHWRVEVTNKEGALQFALVMLSFEATNICGQT